MKLIKVCLLAGAMAIPAFAQSCDEEFLSGVKLQDPGRVERAISMVKNHGAEVRIRVISSNPFSTLVPYEDKMEHVCQSWQAVNGGRKSNLLVLMVDMEHHRSGVWYGRQWDPVLQTQWGRINGEVISPKLHDGDVAGGIAAGLNEMAKLMTSWEASKFGMGGKVEVANEAPVDLSWVRAVFLIIGVFSLTLLAYFWRGRRLRRREEALGAQQGALIAQQRATEMIAEMAASDDPQVKARHDAAVESYGQLGSGAMDPTRSGLTASQYDTMRLRYQEIANNLRISKFESSRMSGSSTYRPEPNVSHKHERIVYDEAAHQGTVIREEHHYHDTVTPIYVPGGTNVVPVFIPEPTYYPAPEPYREPSEPRYEPEPPSYSPPDSGGDQDWGGGDSGGGGGDCGSDSGSSGGGGDSGF